ncbi:glycosyl transferase [Pseudoroseomonas aestuarii]|uniref:Glycosyl transferase n=1 Tax=Teichococcus aestuarii TaxID=568898 RepID=A0A2U1V128_9PROT|nr:glycosyl transferase [Pseudoroseomonas aestuarii]
MLVCFSHLRWNFVQQRPQHLLNRAVADHLVIYFEEPVWEEGLETARLDIHAQPSGVRVAVPVLPAGLGGDQAIEAQRGMLDEVLDAHAGQETIFWYYTPMALQFAGHREPDLCVYDCMDELSAFRGAPPELVALEARLFDLADLVFAGGQSLYEAKRSRHPSVQVFPSSIDKAHFIRARQPGRQDPADQRDIPHPRIGFFGVIDERMDTALVARVAALRPEWHFVMLGPVVKIDPASLPRLPNLHWLGSKSYQELPAYLAGWDAGLMPFALNETTRYISPTKTPEFLAAGIPLVSTAVRDVQRPYGALGLVGIAAGEAATVQALEAAMSRPRGPWLASVDRYLADLSWDATWGAMHQLMRQRAERSLPMAVTASDPAAGTGRRVHV